VSYKIVMSKMPDPIVETARAMLPAGYELEVVDESDPKFATAMLDADFFMGFARGNMGPEFYRAAPRLKLIQLISAGYDRVDLEAARAAKMPVANNNGANSVAVAEHTLLLILAVARKLVWHHNNVAAGKWRIGDFASNRLYEVQGKTLGIVGLGNIGKKVARRAQAFDMRVQYYDVLRLTEDQEDALGVRFVLLDELLRSSDIVTTHVPLTDRTRKMMGAREFGLMKPTGIFINTCRGPVVDEDALYKALTEKRILAAGLDVMVEEPPRQNHPLFKLENVTLTPHTAGPTWENWTKAFRNAYDNIQRVARGDRAMWIIPELR
jgi:phosphoglycerate dehydrogenase-like enzyme